MSLWHNYKSTILLLTGILLGGLLGAFCPALAPWLSPIGNIFMNLLFVLIVPMVFFSIASSVCNLSEQKTLGRTLGLTFGWMLGLMLLLSLISYAGARIFPPSADGLLSVDAPTTAVQPSFGDLLVGALTVSDFGMLLSVRHILPLMVISALLGWAASKMPSPRFSAFLSGGSALVMKMMDLLMIVAPVGLGCYFVGIMSQGSVSLIAGYGKYLVLYLLLTFLVYCVLWPAIAWLTLGRKGLLPYWRAVLQPSLMAVSTLSSSATMPTNITAAKRLGVAPEVAETVIPLGTQIFKAGSVLGGVLKVAFVMLLCGQNIASPEAAFLMIGVGFLSSVVVGAVPTGAGTGELLICSILGADPAIVGILMVISTLIDMPATLLNVSGNTILSLLVHRSLSHRSLSHHSLFHR